MRRPRAFLGLRLPRVRLLAVVLACLCVFSAAPREARAEGKLRVAVFEYVDAKERGATGTDGAVLHLRKAGAEVVYLDITRSPLEQDVDVIVFGAFCDALRAWRGYIDRHRLDIQSFIAAGGLLVEMAQSDDRWALSRWLPKEFTVRRTDRDVHTVRLVGPRTHPMVAWAPVRKVKGERFLHWKPAARDPVSWEGFAPVEGVQVLMSEDAQLTRPQMVVGAYGKGQFLMTSLHVDRVYYPDGSLRVSKESAAASRAFFKALVKYGGLVGRGKAPPVVPSLQAPVGPVLGHIDDSAVHVWYRPSVPGVYELAVRPAAGGTIFRVREESLTSRDRTVHWQMAGLTLATDYVYTIRDSAGRSLAEASFTTAPAPEVPSRVRLALGSCAKVADSAVWDRMVSAGADAIVLLGDTPYIDSTRLDTARARHRRFLQTPSLAAAVREIPLWSTWDDHDFGKDGANGLLRGKAGPRQAYTEYRAQARYGHDGQGIYTRVRHGPVEVFLLDARWFAGTEPSPAAPKQPTCLGRRQWAWLLRALRASSAPFKVLATGMVWHDKGGKATDDWASYLAERDALFAWIRSEGITGCVLVGGDLQASQHLVHPAPGGEGYALHEMIVSPLHDGVLPALDRDHPHKTWSAAEKHVFLLLDADTKASVPALTASWIRADGKVLHKERLRSKDLGGE